MVPDSIVEAGACVLNNVRKLLTIIVPIAPITPPGRLYVLAGLARVLADSVGANSTTAQLPVDRLRIPSKKATVIGQRQPLDYG